MKIFDVIIIGGGPSGLCLAYYLERQGIDYLILEKEHSAGATWNKMPEHLCLITLWKSNALVKEDLKLFPITKKLTAQEFYRYLKSFAQRNKLKIKPDTLIETVECKDGVFLIKTDNERFMSRKVVNCSGYFSHPKLPEVLNKKTNIPILHFNDYKNKEQLKPYKKILIVGKRLSAGQLIEELHQDHELSISIKSPVKFSSPNWLYSPMLLFLDEIEWFIKKIKPKMALDVLMERKAKPTFDSGQIKIYPEIKSLDNESATFIDNQCVHFDLILCATGYSYEFNHLNIVNMDLKDGFESTEKPGLFFLGLDSQQNFTSRFLRGIRQDSQKLARLLVQRLAKDIS